MLRTDSLAQYELFDYCPNQQPGDLQRLNVVLKQIPYKPLLQKLDNERGNGRNDNPNQVMFFILVDAFLLQRLGVNSMRRELAVNPSLRTQAGLNDEKSRMNGGHLVPTKGTFSLFMKRLVSHQADLDAMYSSLRSRVYREIPGIGIRVAGDGKYFDSFTPNQHAGEIDDTKRAEHDATYSKKSYTFTTETGEHHTKSETHYGFRKHTIVDSVTELPLGSILTPANKNEIEVMTDLFAGLPPYVTEKMQYAAFDRGYDSRDFMKTIRSYHVKPIIDKRMMRKGDTLLQYKDTIVYYTEAGEVYYLDFAETRRGKNPDTGYPYCIKRAKFLGYEESRGALRYQCGFHVYRLYIRDEPRMFNEVARDSEKFRREYDMRTSVERYHSRLDCDFGFETHTIRGIDKMRVMVTMADIVMLAIALAHKELGQSNYASIFDFDFF